MSSDTRALVRSDFWFEDGNIVLISSQVGFKVHRGQLERHSEVFDGLFSVPQPANPDLFEGCLCVELFDSPGDILYFLSALYDGLYFKTPLAGDFAAIAAVLRLSSKYLVEHLRQRCMARLELDWPATLAGWDRREQEATDDRGRYIPRDVCPHPILLINFALEIGLNALLPAAFYDLSRYGPSKIAAGTPAFAPPVVTSDSCTPAEPAAPVVVYLTRALLTRTLRGRESAQRFISAFVETELKDRAPAEACSTKRTCSEAFYFVTLNVLRAVGGIACGRDGDALFTLLQAVDMLSRTDFSDGERQCGLGLCGACGAEFAATAGRARGEVWGNIPGWFGLDGGECGA